MTTVNVTRGDTTIVRIITAGPQGPAGGGGGGAGTDLSYDAATRLLSSSTGTDVTLPVATTALAGLESAADKTKLDSITVDSATLARVYVRNNSGVTIPKGAACYQTGSSGTTITVALADASVEATAAQTLGLAQEAIAHNANGYIVAVGVLDGINTSALTEGALVWLSETTGEVTSTRPMQPAHGVVIGYCVKQAAGTAGIIYCKVDNGLELEELHDVLIVTPTTGQVLRRAADGLWKNATLSVSDVSGALSTSTAATTYQPLDSDLTSIAALTTTTFGRSLLTQADAAAARTTLGAGTGNGTVTGVTATGPITSSGGTAPVISTSMTTNRLLGRSTAGTGVAEEIQLGANLTLSGGVLSASVTGGGGGTVTSVGLSLPSIFTVSGSPVTTSGTLTGSLATQSANVVLAGPTTGAAAQPTFRALVTADLPGTGAFSVLSASLQLTLPNGAVGTPTARDLYAVSNTLRYRDSTNTERLLLNATDNLANLSNTTTARSNIGAAASGAIGSSGLTMAADRLLGRTTAATGAPEEITVGSGLSLSGGTLTATGGGGGSSAVYQEFTSSGTWTKPAGCVGVYVEVVSGGGGGGSGRRGAAGTARSGGAGGAGGRFSARWMPASAVGATETITVGAGGAGGGAITTDDTNGNTGTGGGSSSFGSLVIASASNGGAGGNTTSVLGGQAAPWGASGLGGLYAVSGASATATGGNGLAGSRCMYGPGSGAGGGGLTTSNAGAAAAAGGQGFAEQKNSGATGSATGGGGAAGALPTQNGGDGPTYGDGGGSGRCNPASISGNGGNGAFPGGGGGGGGGSENGFNSGGGGNGAAGVVRVWSW